MCRAFFLKAKTYLDAFYEEAADPSNMYPYPKDKYIIKQLEFMGWVPESEYRIRDKYAYFITNKRLEGNYYIYPKRFSDSYATKNKAEFYHYYMGLIGLPGITRVQYSKTYGNKTY